MTKELEWNGGARPQKPTQGGFADSVKLGVGNILDAGLGGPSGGPAPKASPKSVLMEGASSEQGPSLDLSRIDDAPDPYSRRNGRLKIPS